MLSWPGFKPGLLQPQCRELTTIRPQGTTGLRLEIWPTACLSDAERELKSLLGTSKKDTATSHWHYGKQRSQQDANLRRENPMDFESIALSTRPRLRECQLPNEANAGCYISSCGGGFYDADPGNAQHCKFPRSLISVSLSSLFWAWNRLHVGTSHDFARLLLFAAGQLSWLQEGSTWLQRALDTKSSCRMRWQKAESCSRCPTAKCCLDPDSNQVCYSHNAEN